MKKVLIITVVSGFLPQFEKNDVRILQEAGCEVHYASNFEQPVYPFDEEELRAQGIVLHPISVVKSPKRFKENAKAVSQLIRIMDENEIDMIHCHNPMGGVCGRIAAMFAKRKPYVIYTAHGFHFYKGARKRNWLMIYPVEKLLARHTDILITINREDYKRAASFRLKAGGRAVQIHGVGVDRERFRPMPETAGEKRRQLGIPENAFHLVQAAELNDNKNQKTVIEALGRMPQKDIYYSVCGTGPNEHLYHEMIRENNMKGRIRMLGFRTDMEEVLQTADAFIFPSYREGLGVAAIEALLCGIPVIAGENRGTREYAIDGYNAVVVNPGDAAGFENAVGRLYENRGFLEGLGKNARHSAAAFTIDEVGKTMKQVYEAALRAMG